MMATRIILAALACACFIPAPAAAQEPSRGYMGIAFGQGTVADWDASVIDDGSLTAVTVDDTDNGIRIMGGFEFSPNVAVEFGFVDLGEVTARGTSDGSVFWAPGPVDAKFNGSGFDLAVLGRVPVSDSFLVHGRLGVLVWDAEASITDSSGTLEGSDDGNDTLFGVGFEFRTSEVIALRGDFIRYAFDDIDVDTLSLSLVYRIPQAR